MCKKIDKKALKFRAFFILFLFSHSPTSNKMVHKDPSWNFLGSMGAQNWATFSQKFSLWKNRGEYHEGFKWPIISK